MKSGGVDSNGDDRVGDLGEADANGCDDANCGDGNKKFDCGDDLDGVGSNNENDGGAADDDGVDSNICNDINCSDGKSKVDWCEDTAGAGCNSNADSGPSDYGGRDTDGDGRDGDDSNAVRFHLIFYRPLLTQPSSWSNKYVCGRFLNSTFKIWFDLLIFFCRKDYFLSLGNMPVMKVFILGCFFVKA